MSTDYTESLKEASVGGDASEYMGGSLGGLSCGIATEEAKSVVGVAVEEDWQLFIICART